MLVWSRTRRSQALPFLAPRGKVKRVRNGHVIQFRRSLRNQQRRIGRRLRISKTARQAKREYESCFWHARSLLLGQRIGPDLELHDLAFGALSTFNVPDEMRAVV